MFDASILAAAAAVLDAARARGFRLATAESCTGGLIAGALTEIPGSSDVLDRGFVTYSNQAKSEMLSVPDDLIARLGAVSEPVAIAMAEGAVGHSGADVAVAVTGIAGPGGATPDKPVGLVYLATARRGGRSTAIRRVFDGDRAAIRLATVAEALRLLDRQLADP